MKKIKILMMVLSLSVMYQFASAQSGCSSGYVRMHIGPKVKGCGCHCQKKCVPFSDTLSYLNAGWYYGGSCLWGSCCWVRNGEVIPGTETTLTGIYPNPVSNSTTVFFSLSQTQNVSVKVFDITGSLVMTVTDEVFEEGENEIIWNVSDVKSGIYFLRLEAGTYNAMKKVSVIK